MARLLAVEREPMTLGIHSSWCVADRRRTRPGSDRQTGHLTIWTSRGALRFERGEGPVAGSQLATSLSLGANGRLGACLIQG